MGNFIDLTGQKFGKLTVIEKSDKKGTNEKRIYWLCLCECGNKTIVSSKNLRAGKTISCGCSHKHPNNFIDLTGQKFGKLTVIERDMSYRDKGVYWKCVCECGNEKTVYGKSLRSGDTKSCGCLQKTAASKALTKNLIGQKFGKLTVIEKTEKRSSCNRIIWKCICECGNICEASVDVLKRGDKQSCGCIGKSRGEDKIINILKENNILFETEKKFSTCKFPSTNAYARFDFYVNNQYLIEFDGRQHFLQSQGWEDIAQTQMRDNFKNQWCKENNIPLIRIPYTHINDIVLEDLQLNTSKFIIKDDN